MGFLEGISINLSTLLNSSLAPVLLSVSYSEVGEEGEEASSTIKINNHRWPMALAHWLQRF
jgi:hypothetical protein